MLTQLLVWSPLIVPGAVVLASIALAIRQNVRNAATRRDLRARSAEDAARHVYEAMDARFQDAFAKRKAKVHFNDLSSYAGFEEQVAAAAARYRYQHSRDRGKTAVYEISLPSEHEIAAAPGLEAARDRVRAEFAVDPFDQETRAKHSQLENREQRTINWFNGLMLMPAVVCLAITVVALGGGRSHEPGEERIVDDAPIFVIVTGILTVALAVPATIFIVKHYRRMKHHKNLADGPKNALAWDILTTQVQPSHRVAAGSERR